jgi:hypothetical protein
MWKTHVSDDENSIEHARNAYTRTPNTALRVDQRTGAVGRPRSAGNQQKLEPRFREREVWMGLLPRIGARESLNRRKMAYLTVKEIT